MAIVDFNLKTFNLKIFNPKVPRQSSADEGSWIETLLAVSVLWLNSSNNLLHERRIMVDV